MKRFVIYFTTTLVIGLLFLGLIVMEFRIENHYRDQFMVVPMVTANTVLPIIMGIVLGAPRLYHTVTKEGVWRYDWVKVLAISLPLLYVTMLPLLTILGIMPGVLSPPWLFQSADSYLPISGLILGFTVISNLYKR
ncbi:hypothetical protein ACFFGV_04015 [Pontibacillus salicampi]|uniref:Uncharacterized protein n=1 Tax=Pontibacillus salicampi TaxID=1449801 RepID=A0ABV6LK34_9BACI